MKSNSWGFIFVRATRILGVLHFSWEVLFLFGYDAWSSVWGLRALVGNESTASMMYGWMDGWWQVYWYD